MKQITLLDVKQAMKDERFRRSLPEFMLADVQKYESNPSCACNTPIYKRVARECAAQLRAYYPAREVADIAKETAQLAQNHWTVVNCTADQLQARLAGLGPGGKQVAVARYEDEITLIVNEVDYSEGQAGTAPVNAQRWTVIDAGTTEVEDKLRRLGPGRKYLAAARFKDRVTVVVHDLDAVFSL